MAGRKHIILHEPECVIGEAATHHGTPMLFYKLTEIIGIDDMSLYASRCKGSRPKPTEIDPFLYFVGTREGEDF
jgi:hypothetical protein